MSKSVFKRVSDHVDWYTPDKRTDRPSLGAVHGTHRTLLLEGGASPEHSGAFVAELTERGRPPISAIWLSHWHWDHTFGSTAIDVPVIAHRETARELATQASYTWTNEALDRRVHDGTEIAFCAEMMRLELGDVASVQIELPSETFDSEHVVDLGGIQAIIRHVGGDHARDSTVVFVPQDHVLFLGDCLYERLYAVEPLLTPSGVLELHEALRPLEPKVVIEGHQDILSGSHDYFARLERMRAAADLVASHGEDARAAARDEEFGELVDLLLVGTKSPIRSAKP